eukprot:scaffold40452_cov380-Skeletonema_marinoi.AAC.1
MGETIEKERKSAIIHTRATRRRRRTTAHPFLFQRQPPLLSSTAQQHRLLPQDTEKDRQKGKILLRLQEEEVMNKERFKEASKLRRQRNIKLPSRQERENAAKGKACDDADIAKRTSDLKKVIEEAFDPERDIDEESSIRGIEHFVYPALQQEMIR